MGWLWWSNFTWEDEIILLPWETLPDSTVDPHVFTLRVFISPGHARHCLRDAEAATRNKKFDGTEMFSLLHYDK